jgi:tetratricopeptide (TPR) repeat protein
MPETALEIPEEEPVAEAVPTPLEDIPDWLKEATSPVATEEVPAWLIETINEEQPQDIGLPPLPPPPVQEARKPQTKPLPPLAPPPPPPAAPKPAPVIAQGSLDAARGKSQGGDLEGSLAEYEGLIRANAQLEEAVSDLQALAEDNKGNPALYRVLGDGLMRQGKLQQALDIYREALNQL